MVKEFVDELGIPRAEKKYLHFARIDRVEHFDGLEGILFLATPDILSGLTTWAYFDNNSPDTVMAMFGSGCCSVVTQAGLENRMRESCLFGTPAWAKVRERINRVKNAE